MMRIDSHGLILRPPVPADLPALFALTAPDAMREFLGPTPPSESESFARLLRAAGSWALYGYGIFVVIDEGSGALIGTCGVFHSHRGLGADFDDTPEAGWIIAQDRWGGGLASRVMQAAIDWFDARHGPQRVVCMIEQGHGASDVVARKLGFAPFRVHQPADAGARALTLYERAPGSSAARPSR